MQKNLKIGNKTVYKRSTKLCLEIWNEGDCIERYNSVGLGLWVLCMW
jgi:hypothetical protein